MVESVDGRAALHGSAVGIGSPDDKRLLYELRAEADVVLHGASTVRADPLSARVPPDLVAQRIAHGLEPQPLGAIVTRSGNLPANHPYYRSATLIYVLSDSSVPVTQPTVEVCRVSTVDDVIHDLTRRGVKRVVSEGGPTLNSALFESRLVDEMYVTIAPKLIGGEDPLTIVRGRPIEPPLRLELRSLVERQGELFLKYGVIYPL